MILAIPAKQLCLLAPALICQQDCDKGVAKGQACQGIRPSTEQTKHHELCTQYTTYLHIYKSTQN